MAAKPQYVFKMKLKGTALKPIFNFKKSVLSKGIMQWHITETNIQCSEINPTERILINYTLEGKNLSEYKYNFKSPNHTIMFEIQEFSNPISTMKISDTLKVFVMDTKPNVLHVHIIDRENNIRRKKIQTQIEQEVTINVSPEIYSSMSVNLEPETFSQFMRISQNIAKTNNMRIKIMVQAPDYVSFSRDGSGEESQSHGKFKAKKSVFEGEFYVSEVKHVLKLTQCTNILSIYQPISDVAPLYIRGNIKTIGEFHVYIHQCDVIPLKEIDKQSQ